MINKIAIKAWGPKLDTKIKQDKMMRNKIEKTNSNQKNKDQTTLNN